jgi:hypothetical protein
MDGRTIFISVAFVIYFLPAIVAWCRGHRNEYAIGILNMFLGWTLEFIPINNMLGQ